MDRSKSNVYRYFRSRTAFLVLCVLFASGVLLFLAQRFGLFTLTPVFIERLQLGLFPFFVFVLWQLRIGIPSSILAGACIAAASAVASAYTIVESRTGDRVFLTRFGDDPDESRSRIFRERFNSFLAAQGINGSGERYFRSFDPDSELAVRKLFASEQNISAVVWGNQRWINISFPLYPAVSVGALSGQAPLTTTVKKLEIVQSVPMIGLSLNPEDATSAFLGFITPTISNDGEFTPETLALREVLLLSASSLTRPWSAQGHRGYAWWRLGTDALIAFLKDGTKDPALLDCAGQAFRQASFYVQPGGNPELRAAILNNQGVLDALRADVEGSSDSMRKATANFAIAYRTSRDRDVFNVKRLNAFTARSNIEVLRGPRKKSVVRARAHGNSTKG